MHTSLEKRSLREELQKCVLFLLAEADFFREGVFQEVLPRADSI